MGNPEAASAEPQIIGEKSSIGVLLKLAQLYRIISKADDQEIAILLAYAQNLMAARPGGVAPDATVTHIRVKKEG